MKLPAGRELLATIAYPIPITIAGQLMGGIGRAAERCGYTDVTIDPSNGRIAGTPPPPGTRLVDDWCWPEGGNDDGDDDGDDDSSERAET